MNYRTWTNQLTTKIHQWKLENWRSKQNDVKKKHFFYLNINLTKHVCLKLITYNYMYYLKNYNNYLYYINSKSSLRSLYSRTCFLIAELSTQVTKSSKGLKNKNKY